jgi:FlaA1/EpsC-like NDP-sugar epimerase
LRPGEKLYEELFHEKEALQSTPHKKILLARHRTFEEEWFTEILDGLLAACQADNEVKLRALLGEIVPEWSGSATDDYKMVSLQPEDALRSAEKANVLH